MNNDKPLDLKILISCHKEITLPEAEVYLPVQVGAANTDVRLAGMQPDNEGENISDRNFTFCELTAQYWAWKNLKADYVGLCHYRRFFYFGRQNYAKNDHFQIEADALSEYSIRDFRLNDSALIRSEVEGYDLVTAPYWDVSKAIAPGGVKSSVAEHMIAYGLFEEEDLKKLRSIVAQRQPAYLSYFDSYINGKKYLGYSCYIMRQELFDRFCEFEFDILRTFDETFDYSYLTTTKKRICGYFGEILYSVFVESIRAEGQVKIKQVPLVFFFDTSIDPFTHEDQPCDLEIVWRYRDFSTSALLAGAQSLIDHLDSAKTYRLTVLHEENFVYPNFEIAFPTLPENLIVSHAHWTEVALLPDWRELSIEDLDMVEPLLLPWLSSANHPLLWIDGLAAFTQDPVNLLEPMRKEEVFSVKGLQNILLQRELNKPENRSILERYGLTTRGSCFVDSTVLLIEPVQMRSVYDVAGLKKAYSAVKDSCEYAPSPKPRFGEVRKADFKLVFYQLSNQAFRARLMDSLGIGCLSFDTASICSHYSDTLEWANAAEAQAWRSASCPALMYCEYGRIPLMDESYYLSSFYWRASRHSKAYETLLREVFDPTTASAIGRLLPAGTRRGQMARRMLKRLKG